MSVALMVFCSFAPAAATAPPVPQGAFLGVSSAILYDLDTEAILFEQNADARIPPASLTKVLSMFLVLDHINDGRAGFNSVVSVSRAAASETGSRMGLQPNDQVNLQELLLGMAVSSGNDASTAVAEFVGGSTPAFVRMMNVKAQQLGMLDSNFCNPHGLPHRDQYTTARDMLTLARAYLRAYPFALQFHSTSVFKYRGSVTWNKNPLLGQYEGADGLKTGWIRNSGYNLIFTASHGRKRLLAVILGAPDVSVRGNEAGRLLDAGFLVCGNQAVSVASALYNTPLPQRNLDTKKNAHEAALYQVHKGYSSPLSERAGRNQRRK
jgi:D-alanyl-D-alanine carboxypeptidase (penicillin-binding protein 5/6)